MTTQFSIITIIAYEYEILDVSKRNHERFIEWDFPTKYF